MQFFLCTISLWLWCDGDQGRIEVNSNYWLLQPCLPCTKLSSQTSNYGGIFWNTHKHECSCCCKLRTEICDTFVKLLSFHSCSEWLFVDAGPAISYKWAGGRQGRGRARIYQFLQSWLSVAGYTTQSHTEITYTKLNNNLLILLCTHLWKAEIHYF